MSEYHTPVMLDESISALVTNPSGTYADATFGGGGHTAELLSRLNEDGHVIAFDRDSDAISNRIDDPRLTMVRADFRFIHNFVLNEAHETSDETLKGKLTNGLDGILADLGVSSHQRHGRKRVLLPLRRASGHEDEPRGRQDSRGRGQ